MAAGNPELESRLVWMFGSPRTGSTWLLRLLIHPWDLSRRDPTGLRPPGGGARAPGVVPVNESHLPIHLTPIDIPPYERGVQPPPAEFLKYTRRADHAGYFFNDHYAADWRPPVREMILARFGAQAERAAREHSMPDPLVVIKEPNGSHGAELVMSLLPRARLIFLTRDGRDVVDSQLDLLLRGRLRRRGGGGNEKRRLELVLRHSRLWVNRMNAVEGAFRAHQPELRYRLRYEDLRRDPVGVLRPLLDWLGLARSDAEVAAAIRDRSFDAMPAEEKGPGTGRRAVAEGSWREHMTEEEQRVMHEVLATKLAELGYSDAYP